MNTLPIIMLAFIYVHHQTTNLGRAMAMLMFSVLSLCTVLANWLCSRISHSARDPYTEFNSLLSESTDLSIVCRLKSLSFIEKLSGPAIGFKCGPVFSMSKLQFLQYIIYMVMQFLQLQKYNALIINSSI